MNKHNEGFYAAMYKEEIRPDAVCPYVRGSFEFQEWYGGWNSAQRFKEERRVEEARQAKLQYDSGLFRL